MTQPAYVRPRTDTDDFRRDVLAGLSRAHKEIPCKYLYDARGAELFEAITQLEEYYPTRTELAIMNQHGAEMAQALGPRCLVVEFGSGSSRKTRILLDHLEEPAGYVPIDISQEQLEAATASLMEEYPDLAVLPVAADYTAPVTLPNVPHERRVVYFPGSTIGNLAPAEAAYFLRRAARLTGRGGLLLIGVDVKKDKQVLERAYNDSQGITAAFNRNVLVRINRELNGNFPIDAFRHAAPYNEDLGRIEMQLVCSRPLMVQVGPYWFPFEANESIRTEHCYKYSLHDFATLASEADLTVQRIWTDANDWFSVQLLKAA